MEAPSNRFQEFWDAYDKKVGRKKAEQKYRLALKKPAVTEDLLIAAAAQYVAWQRSEGKHPQFSKDPATWLNGEHWTDERAGRPAPTGQHLRALPDVSQIEEPPPGLDAAAYDAWFREQVAKRKAAGQ